MEETKKYEFTLVENGINIYSDDDLNLVIHEMLSILYNNISFLKLNNILSNVQTNNTRIDVFLKNKGKRYPVKYCNIIFRLDNFVFDVSPNVLFFNLEHYNIQFIEQLKNLLDNNIAPKFRSKDTDAVQILEIPKSKFRSLDNTDMIPQFLEASNSNKKSSQLDIGSLLNKTVDLLNTDIKLETEPFIEKLKKNKQDQDQEEEDQEEEKIDIVKIKEHIDQLEKIKTEHEEKFLDVKNKHCDEMENMVDYECEINAKKMVERINKDKEEQDINKYFNDKESYYRMKNDIELGFLKEENISPLFRQKYPIYKIMDENGDLDTDNEYQLFCDLYEELYPNQIEKDKPSYVPHSYNYLSEEEKGKYSQFIVDNKEKIPSYDDLLMELSEQEREELINSCGIDGDNVLSNNIQKIFL